MWFNVLSAFYQEKDFDSFLKDYIVIRIIKIKKKKSLVEKL